MKTYNLLDPEEEFQKRMDEMNIYGTCIDNKALQEVDPKDDIFDVILKRVKGVFRKKNSNSLSGGQEEENSKSLSREQQN